MTEQQERRYEVRRVTFDGVQWHVVDWAHRRVAVCTHEADAHKIADALNAAESPMQVFMDFEAKWLQAEERVLAAERERDIAYAEINELGFEAETLKAEVERLKAEVERLKAAKPMRLVDRGQGQPLVDVSDVEVQP